MTDVPAELPSPRDDDDDDVAWALQTARVEWQRGAYLDAVTWLRRAADSAIRIGATGRAWDLKLAASKLTEVIPKAPASSRPSAAEPRLPTAHPRATTPLAPAPFPASAPPPASAPLPRSTAPSATAPTPPSARPRATAPMPSSYPAPASKRQEPAGGVAAKFPRSPTRPPARASESPRAQPGDSVDELLSMSQPLADADLYDDGTDIIDMPAPMPSSRPSAGGAAHAADVEEPGQSEPVPGSPTLEDDALIEELDADFVDARVIDESSDTIDEEEEIEEERQSLLSDVLEPEADDSEAALLSQQLAEEIEAGLESRDSRELLIEELERQALDRSKLAAKPEESEEEPTHRLRVDAVAEQRARESGSLADELAPSLAPASDSAGDELRPSLADDLEPDQVLPPKTLRDLAKAVAPSSPKGSIDWDDDATERSKSSSPARARSGVPRSPSPRVTSRSSVPASGSARSTSVHPKPTARAKQKHRGSTQPKAAGLSSAPSRSEPGSAGRFADQSPSEPPTTPDLLGISLDRVRGLQDLPQDSQLALSQHARIETLSKDEELNGFAVALVLKGSVKIMPAIADAVCAHASAGDVVFTQGHLPDGVMLRVVADAADTRVAFWDARSLAAQLANCPWVDDDLRTIADRFQALAGAAMGSLGERLDDDLRALVTDRCQVVALEPGETLLTQGETVNGMYVVGGGHIELLDGDRVTEALYPGEFLFAAQVMAGGGAPNTVRAGTGGALLLRAERMAAHELLVSVPPLLEILAG